MKVMLMSVCVVLSLAVAGLSGGPRAQEVSRPADSAQARHNLAISLLRAINTAELDYKLKHGTYTTWETLVKNGDFTEQGTRWTAADDPLAHSQFATDPAILPGWKLRLNLVAGGKGYDLLLEDATDDACGYAAVTDERGVIRQAKAIDCDF